MNIHDVIIIGGGVTGSAIARELSRYKLKVALLEKEEELAFGVSKSNSGIIHPGTQNPPNSLKGRLCLRGNILSKKIARDLGIDLQEVGELIVAMNESEVPVLVEIKDEAEKLGVPGLRIVGPEWLRENEPNLTREAVCALYAPTAGIISPYRWVYDFCENAAANGVEIHRTTKVASIKKVKRQGSRAKGRELFEIITTKGTFTTRFVVNAAGLHADDIAKMVGINDFQIKPRKGEEFILDKKRHNITNHLIFPIPTATSKGILIIKTSDGNPMVGPTAEEVGRKEDLSTTEEGLKKVLAAAKCLVPSIDENDIIAYFAGLRPASGEDFIIRHEARVPGMVTVAGIQSPGLTAAPAIAEMVSGLLGGNGLRLKKKFFFKAHRKELNHLFAIPLSKTKSLIKKDASYGDIVCRCEMVSAKEIRDAISRGASTLDGVKFRTRAQAGRCHGSFCTTRIMKILSEETGKPMTGITKRGCGSEMLKSDRADTR
jgi:glycerol-3-phosphate dehydrogenase